MLMCRSNLCLYHMFNLWCSALIQPLLLLILTAPDESIFFLQLPLSFWSCQPSASERNECYALVLNKGPLQFPLAATREHSYADEEMWSLWKCPESPLIGTSICTHFHLISFAGEAVWNLHVTFHIDNYQKDVWGHRGRTGISPSPTFPSFDPDSTSTQVSIVKDRLSVGKYASSCPSMSESYGASGGSFVPLICLENDWGGCNEVSSLGRVAVD